jgi:serine/threonine protein kinase/formylglycine-generating enzyme required for sulfatase activity
LALQGADVNEERWDEIDAVYGRALDLPVSERRDFVASRCGEDQDLFDAVMELLEANPPSDFMEPFPGETPQAILGVGLGGKTLGEFKLVREIGRGGMGVIYLATNPNYERLLALKLLPPARAGSEVRTRFEREIQAASSLDHPSIVAIHEFGETDDIAWYAMDHVAGHDLSAELGCQRSIRDGLPGISPLLPSYSSALYVPTVASRISDLALALDAAHQQDVIHRDVKPQNVLLDERGSVQLTDFGLAKDARFGTMTRTGAVQGTPYYMSPEQARALRKSVDHRTDVYSLSVVLFECLALRRPFEGETPEEILEGIGKGSKSNVRQHNLRVPRDLSLICQKGMSRDPEDRYATALAMSEDLQRFLRHEAVLAKAPTANQIMTRWVRKNLRGIAAAVVAILALAAGMAYADWRTSTREASALAVQIDAALDREDWSTEIPHLTSLRRRADGWDGRMTPPLASAMGDFTNRLKQFRVETTARARERIELGRGAGRGLPLFEPYLSPIRPREFREGVITAEALLGLFPEDKEITQLASIESSYAQVSISALIVESDGTARPADVGSAKVWLAPIDPLEDSIGESILLGDAPIELAAVPPGYYRVRVAVDGFGRADLMRTLAPTADPITLTARVHATQQVVADMVRFEGGRLELMADRKIGCLLDASEVEVDVFYLERTELSNARFLQYLADSGAEPPSTWTKLGFEGDWQALPIGTLGDAWLRRPVAMISALDAQACAEWFGKRLPRHVELELAYRSIDSNAPAHRSGDFGGELATMDLAAMFQHAAEQTLEVNDARFTQTPSGLIHALGNVHEVTSSFLVVRGAEQLTVRPDLHIALGQDWESDHHGHSPDTHYLVPSSSEQARLPSGVRLAF